MTTLEITQEFFMRQPPGFEEELKRFLKEHDCTGSYHDERRLTMVYHLRKTPKGMPYYLNESHSRMEEGLNNGSLK